MWRSANGGESWEYLGERIWTLPEGYTSKNTSTGERIWYYKGGRINYNPVAYKGVQLPPNRNTFVAQDAEEWYRWQQWFHDTVARRLNANPLVGLGAVRAVRDNDFTFFAVQNLSYRTPSDSDSGEVGMGPSDTVVDDPWARLFLILVLQNENLVRITLPPNLYTILTVAMTVESESIKLYIGGHEGKVFKTEIPLQKLEGLYS